MGLLPPGFFHEVFPGLQRGAKSLGGHCSSEFGVQNQGLERLFTQLCCFVVSGVGGLSLLAQFRMHFYLSLCGDGSWRGSFTEREIQGLHTMGNSHNKLNMGRSPKGVFV